MTQERAFNPEEEFATIHGGTKARYEQNGVQYDAHYKQVGVNPTYVPPAPPAPVKGKRGRKPGMKAQLPPALPSAQVESNRENKASKAAEDWLGGD